MLVRPVLISLLAGVFGLTISAAALAQDVDIHSWTVDAAKGAFDLCRSDAPDAGAVIEHGEIWGWPHFSGYLEHLDGYHRAAGGESRRSETVGDATVNLDLGVQSGLVTSAAPASIHYFRCDVAADQPMNHDLETYFTGLYGPPATRTEQGAVWLVATGGATVAPADADSDAAAMKPVVAAGVGAGVVRVELSRERGLDRAKLTVFANQAPE